MGARLFVFTLVFAASVVGAQDWQLVWSDEFEYTGAPDPTKWTYDIGGSGWGNQESQHYTNRRENSRVEAGALVIEARDESFGGNPYTSARLVTRGLGAWRYGRIEARIKLPEGQGIWPAFWMLPEDSPYGGWPTSGEIDVMEFLGHEPDRVHGTIHYGGLTHAPCRSSRGAVEGHCFRGASTTLASGTFPDDFHTFAVEWEPTQIRWYLDDELYQTQSYWYSGVAPYPAPFDQPFHLLLNVAVGGVWPGYPDDTTVFPQQMLVDYVRVYQDPGAYPTVALDRPTDGTTISTGGVVRVAATASDGATVTFLQGDAVLGSDAEAPYALDVANAVDGCYAVRARATNAAGYVSETEAVEVVVGGCPDESRAPYLMVPAAIPGAIEAEHYDLGGAGIAYRDLSAANTPGAMRPSEGVDIRASPTEAGAFDVTAVTSREWMVYSVDVAEAGPYRVSARVAGTRGMTVGLSIDGVDLLGDIEVDETGGEYAYATAPLGTVPLPAGRHALRLDIRRGGMSIDRLAFETGGGTSTEDAPDDGLGLRLAPNPASSTVAAWVRLGEAGPVGVRVLDALGRVVVTLGPVPLAAGEHRLGVEVGTLPPGIYILVLTTAQGRATSRLVVAR